LGAHPKGSLIEERACDEENLEMVKLPSVSFQEDFMEKPIKVFWLVGRTGQYF